MQRASVKSTGRIVAIALAIGAGLPGCAVIEVASDHGCASYVVIGLGHIDLRAPSGVTHVRARQFGVFVNQGPAHRFGMGYVDELWVAVDPTAADGTTVDATVADDGPDVVRIRTVRNGPPGKESEDEAIGGNVVCMRDGLRIRRMRE
jgi:hypothetical protein